MFKRNGKVITIAQQKGGAGKTTMACQLAVAYLRDGKTVATIDIDPQASLTHWYTARSALMREQNELYHVPINGWRTQREVERLANEYDIVIIDSPPHAQTEAKIAIRVADLVVVPVQPSPMDVWATKPTLEMANAEKIPVLMVPNRVPGRAKIAQTMLDKLMEFGTEIAETQIGNRVAFSESMLIGKGVLETAKSGVAAREIDSLKSEIDQRLGLSTASGKTSKKAA